MAGRKIQVGQVWRKDGSDDTYLVTKVYSEALATFVILRRTGAEDEAPLRIRVERKGTAQALPGFSFTQESDEF